MRMAINAILRNPNNGPVRTFVLQKGVPGNRFTVDSNSDPVPLGEMKLLHDSLLKLKDTIQRRYSPEKVDSLKEDLENPLLAKELKAKSEHALKQHMSDRQSLRDLDKKISMCKVSLGYRGPLRPPTAAAAVENAHPEAGELSGLAGLPYAVRGRRAISLAVATDFQSIPEEMRLYLLEQVNDIHNTTQDYGTLTVLAPQYAFSEEGELLPLSKTPIKRDGMSVEGYLRQWLSSGGKCCAPSAEGIGLTVLEIRAWQWLIASHNMVTRDPVGRIPIPNALRREWNDPMGSSAMRKKQAQSSLVETLKEEIKRLKEALALREQSTATISKSTVVLVESTQQAVTSLEELVSTPDAVQEPGQEEEKVSLAEGESPEDDSDSELEIPSEVKFESVPMKRLWDEDFYYDLVGKMFTMSVHRTPSGAWAVYHGPPKDVHLDLEKAEIQASPSKKEQPAKKAAKQPRSLSPKPKGQKSKSSPEAGEKKGVPTPPRSQQLSEDSKRALRKFFECKEPLQAVDWEKLTAKQKRTYRGEMAIPAWAVAAVLQKPDNLIQIIKGRLTKESYTPKKKAAPQPKSSRKSESPERGRSRSKKTNKTGKLTNREKSSAGSRDSLPDRAFQKEMIRRLLGEYP